MIVDEEQALERLNSPDNLVNQLEVRKLIGPGRPENRKNTPDMINTLAVAAACETSLRAAGKEFGLNHTGVNYHKKNTDAGKAGVDLARSQALDLMLESITLLKPKLQDVKKATDLSKIATDMARVVEKTTPRETAQTNVKVVVFNPGTKDEDSYEEITVST